MLLAQLWQQPAPLQMRVAASHDRSPAVHLLIVLRCAALCCQLLPVQRAALRCIVQLLLELQCAVLCAVLCGCYAMSCHPALRSAVVVVPALQIVARAGALGDAVAAPVGPPDSKKDLSV